MTQETFGLYLNRQKIKNDTWTEIISGGELPFLVPDLIGRPRELVRAATVSPFDGDVFFVASLAAVSSSSDFSSSSVDMGDLTDTGDFDVGDFWPIFKQTKN